MCRNVSKCISGVMALAILCWAMAAMAQAPGAPSSTQFDITGIIQAATLNTTTAGPAMTPQAAYGGTLKVNGHTIIIPDYTVVQYPQSSSTWSDVFTQAPVNCRQLDGVSPRQSGMCTSDRDNSGNAPFTTYGVHVIGNRVINSLGGQDQYIAGLVTFAQEGDHSDQGFISCIDYTTGDIWVGGTIQYAGFVPVNSIGPNHLPRPVDAFGNPIANAVAGTRIRINDPLGKHGLVQNSADTRFCLDPDNPTIRSVSGYPMGLPTVDPLNMLSPMGVFVGPDDPYRPQNNRVDMNPLLQQSSQPFPALSFTLNAQPLGNNPAPKLHTINNNVVDHPQDSRLQAPIEVGDSITYSGTLTPDTSTNPPTIYFACHTIIDNAAIYTVPGNNPAYAAVDVTWDGTGGVVGIGLNEATTRTRFEGFSTDISRNVYLFGVDLDPFSNAVSNRDWGSIDVDPGPPNGAAKGRWRFRPSNLVVADAPPGVNQHQPQGTGVLTAPSAGDFGKPTREVRAVIAGGFNITNGQFTDPAWIPTGPDTINTVNGIFLPMAPKWVNMPQQALYSNIPTSDVQSPNFLVPGNGSGLITGQYRAPINLYLFPEMLPGQPLVPNNFEVFDWLAYGGQNGVTGQLFPWPGLGAPLAFGPTLTTSGNITVVAGTPVTLTGTAVDPRGVASITWTPGSLADTITPPLGNGTVVSSVTDNTSFTAVKTQTYTLTATNTNGTQSTATVTVTVTPSTPPVLTTSGNITVAAGTNVTLTGTANDAIGVTSIGWNCGNDNITPALPAKSVTDTTSFTAVNNGKVAITTTYTLTANNAGSQSTATVTVTVTPASPPVLTTGGNITVAYGTPVTLTGTAADPTGLTSIAWTPGAANDIITPTRTGNPPIVTSVTDATSFNAVNTQTYTLTATNTSGIQSTATVTVTVTPIPNDTVVITAVDQRTQSRLDVTVVDTPPVNPANGFPFYAVGTQTMTAYFYDKKGVFEGSALMTYQPTGPSALSYVVTILGGTVPTNATTQIIVRSSGGGASVPLINTTGKTLGVWKIR